MASFVCLSLVLTLSGCGFHLRGISTATLPPELSVLRVTMGGSGYPPLLVEVRRALLTLGTVKLTDDAAARVPVLQLLSETTQNQDLAIDSTGRASAYLLNYRADFALAGADGKPLLPAQSVKLQREYTFDRLNVIASEKQSDFIQTEMRRDAAQQIVRRLASLNTARATNRDASQP
jgi:LPS-assembly lipoprotein